MTVSRRPAISAHRGGQVAGVEFRATWEAYQDALSTGAEYVEFDIRRTVDGELVVYHDARASNGGPLLAELRHDELCSLAGYEVPLVAEVMRLVSGKMIGHLDLKEIGNESEIVELALDILGIDGFVVTSLEDVSIASVKKTFPQVKAALSLGRDRREVIPRQLLAVRRSEFFPLRRIRACNADGVALNHQLAPSVLRLCARHHLFAMVWTVNDDNLLRRFLDDRRVDVLVTDFPRRALGLRDTATAITP